MVHVSRMRRRSRVSRHTSRGAREQQPLQKEMSTLGYPVADTAAEYLGNRNVLDAFLSAVLGASRPHHFDRDGLGQR